MCKMILREDQMSSSAVVECRQEASELLRMKARGPGDTSNAMRRIESEYGIPYHAQWSLRYRPPKDVLTSIYFGIKAALQAERQKQMRLYQHERKLTEAIVGSRSRLLRAADFVAGADNSAEEMK